jgi:hypothetical protein
VKKMKALYEERRKCKSISCMPEEEENQMWQLAKRNKQLAAVAAAKSWRRQLSSQSWRGVALALSA